jgi:hypothetical protein
VRASRSLLTERELQNASYRTRATGREHLARTTTGREQDARTTTGREQDARTTTEREQDARTTFTKLKCSLDF